MQVLEFKASLGETLSPIKHKNRTEAVFSGRVLA